MNKNTIKSYIPLERFYIQVTTHCKMNCKYCLTCSPIAQPQECSIEQYKKSLEFIDRFNRGHKPALIQISGGDCLLHSKIDELAYITRQWSSTTSVNLCCNGLHLDEFTKERWQFYKDNKISIKIRSYNFDNFVAWEKAGRDNGVNVDNFNHYIEKPILFYEIKFRDRPTYKGNSMFACCECYMRCLVIDACVTRFYKCERLQSFRHLNLDHLLEEGYDYFDYSNPSKVDYERIKDVYVLPACNYCSPILNKKVVWTNKGQRKREEWIDSSPSSEEMHFRMHFLDYDNRRNN